MKRFRLTNRSMEFDIMHNNVNRAIQDGEAIQSDLRDHRFIRWKMDSELKLQLTKRINALEEKTGSEK